MRVLAGVGGMIFLAFSTVVFATDLKDLQDRCEAYGAKPGTTQFFTCMRELDKERQKKEEYEKAVEDCKLVNPQELIAKGMAANDKPWDAGNGFRQGVKLAQEFPAKCKKAAYQRVYGGQQNTRTVCTRSQDGNRIACEDE